jgi:aspartyl-tRNA synthetase
METKVANLQNLADHNVTKVTIKGWIEKIRRMKERLFIIIKDGDASVQITCESSNPLFKEFDCLKVDSTVKISGELCRNENVRLGGLEIIPDEIEIYSLSSESKPIDATSPMDLRLNWRFLDLRNSKNKLIFKVQTAMEHYMREYWRRENFIEIHSPKLMGSPSESGAELFQVEYFGKPAYLAQSPQFYKQMAMAAAFDKIFEIGPVFRADPSFTSRHSTEFISVDVEISWINSHEDVMKFEEEWINYFLKNLKTEYGEEIKNVFGVEIEVPDLPFPRLSMADAQKIVKESGHTIDRAGDLDPEGEKIVFQYIKKRYGHDFVFVTDYPYKVRPFYHMKNPGNQELTNSFDLLWKGVEITTGAQREHRHEILLKQAIEKGLNPETISYYLDFFRFGCPPHGGFGFGLSRAVMLVLGLKNIREVIYLFRGPNRLNP